MTQTETTCPRCRQTIYWTYTNPPVRSEDDDERDWMCGPCRELLHLMDQVRYWREQGLESLREHRDWLRERAAARTRTAA